jgi:hypothetical protein
MDINNDLLIILKMKHELEGIIYPDLEQLFQFASSQ